MTEHNIPDTNINRALSPEYFRVDPTGPTSNPLLSAPAASRPPVPSADTDPALFNVGPKFADNPDGERAEPGMNQILSGPGARTALPEVMSPVLSSPGNNFTVDIEKLVPAAGKAVSIGQDLKVVSGDVGHGPPIGTPGFKTGFQMGELSREWSAAIMRLANGSQAAADKIYRTRTKYRENETELKTMFGGKP
ncbi:hypothetical protein [Embleya sp. NPDC059237]|uniref:hypothetical protein n=1 Tax=Embleya sp. NPDC059237 TaxID=3346784 RepID=UPI00368EF277